MSSASCSNQGSNVDVFRRFRRAINVVDGLEATSPDRAGQGTNSMMELEGIGSYFESVSGAREADEICGLREEKSAVPMKGKGQYQEADGNECGKRE